MYQWNPDSYIPPTIVVSSIDMIQKQAKLALRIIYLDTCKFELTFKPLSEAIVLAGGLLGQKALPATHHSDLNFTLIIYQRPSCSY